MKTTFAGYSHGGARKGGGSKPRHDPAKVVALAISHGTQVAMARFGLSKGRVTELVGQARKANPDAVPARAIDPMFRKR